MNVPALKSTLAAVLKNDAGWRPDLFLSADMGTPGNYLAGRLFHRRDPRPNRPKFEPEPIYVVLFVHQHESPQNHQPLHFFCLN